MARFVLDTGILLDQYKITKELADTVSYSMKTNPIAGKILEEKTSSLFSVHTISEMNLIKNKKRVVLFAQGWDQKTVKNILTRKVKKIVVDNERDLNMLLENLNSEIDLYLRMRLREKTVHTGKHFVFGMCPEHINKLIPQLKKDKNIKNLGIHFHRKTQNISEWSLKDDLKNALLPETFKSIDMINMGGGLPVKYKNSNPNINAIMPEIRSFKKWLDSNKIKMVIEPGRFLAAPCIKLEAKIINIYNNNIILDCSVFNTAMDTFIANTRLEIQGELDSGTAYSVKGCTPDSMDIFRYRVFLDNPKIGDSMVFLNAGAYNFHSDFCGLERIETIVIS